MVRCVGFRFILDVTTYSLRHPRLPMTPVHLTMRHSYYSPDSGAYRARIVGTFLLDLDIIYRTKNFANLDDSNEDLCAYASLWLIRCIPSIRGNLPKSPRVHIIISPSASQVTSYFTERTFQTFPSIPAVVSRVFPRFPLRSQAYRTRHSVVFIIRSNFDHFLRCSSSSNVSGYFPSILQHFPLRSVAQLYVSAVLLLFFIRFYVLLSLFLSYFLIRDVVTRYQVSLRRFYLVPLLSCALA